MDCLFYSKKTYLTICIFIYCLLLAIRNNKQQRRYALRKESLEAEKIKCGKVVKSLSFAKMWYHQKL